MPKRYVPNGTGEKTGQGRPKNPRDVGGRPTKYSTSFDSIAGDFARMGYCDYEIAEKLDVSIPTFYSWHKLFPNFLKSIKDGRSQSMTGMAYKAVIKALEGGEKKKTKIVRVKNAEGQVTEVREEESIEEVWPCKDTAFKHLVSVVPEYAGLKDSIDKAPLVAALENIDLVYRQMRQESSNGTDEKTASFSS